MTKDKVLIACEFSGRVRDAFIASGVSAVSCDFLPSERPGAHIRGNVLEAFRADKWAAVIAFPPCRYLAASGARWWSGRKKEQAAALAFVETLLSLPVPFLALENPIGKISTAIRKPDQIIHPWQHGHGETKATCLWLRGFPELRPTEIVSGRESPILNSKKRGDARRMERSRTFPGIASAMAAQWSGFFQ